MLHQLGFLGDNSPYSESVVLGTHEVARVRAPAMATGTTGLVVQTTEDPPTTADADATWEDLTFEGTLVRITVSDAAVANDARSLKHTMGVRRIRFRAVNGSDVNVTQTDEVIHVWTREVRFPS